MKFLQCRVKLKMSEIEDLRKKKIELYKQQYASDFQSQLDNEAELQQQVAEIESNVKQLMSAEALERYCNVKLAHPQKALQALVVIAQMIQAGNVRTIDDTQFKSVLVHLTPEKKQTRLNIHGAI